MIYILLPENIIDEFTKDNQILYIESVQNIESQIREASYFTAAFQLSLQFGPSPLEQINFSDKTAYIKQWEQLLVITDDFALTQAIVSYLQIYLQTIGQINMQYGFRMARAIVEFYIRPFLQLCQHDSRVLTSFVTMSIPRDFSGFQSLRAFYHICSLQNLDQRHVVMTKGDKILYENGVNKAILFRLSSDIIISHSSLSSTFSFTHEPYETKQQVPLSQDTIQHYSTCDLLPYKVDNLLRCRNQFVRNSYSGPMYKGDGITPIVQYLNTEVHQYQCCDYGIFVLGPVIAKLQDQIDSLDYKILENLNEFQSEHRSIINQAVGTFYGTPTKQDLFMYHIMKGKFQKILYKGVEIEDKIGEVRFK
ncbi:hypothetical protein SS50377_25786 [Spironucleus salmonicida]|uniref:Uncharacterized protein n=1 Tax=Spironucleus salmonicida TaxID=348837 RepID=V6LVH6_9EUKA|nr:hypothetical protein SS50377_25782 [Spironucleus salmonicida]KAH0571597.1 hypothetical protein SS50377_25786 [Spironucleus salmonicida]|eukprot:EST48238.1 Hypothetical protein SS50377_11580 [Spironucleus salmonicida]